jgi:hypothetical protein
MAWTNPGGYEIERCGKISSRNILGRRRIRGQPDDPCDMVAAGNDQMLIVTVYHDDREVAGVDHWRRKKQPCDVSFR